ncbi:MAG: hypothetical protein IJZ88_06985 [Clostridia bacterium]|nr:hypothetical protein [Clostridia bacterium]
MKKFLSFVTAIVIIAVAVSHKTEILEAVDKTFGAETVINWDEIPLEQSSFGSAYKNHYSKLNNNQKKAYNHILDEIFNAEYEFPDMIQVPLMTGEELTAVVEAVNYDNPTVMCIGRDNTIITSDDLCYLKPNYTMSPPQQRVMLNTLDSVCNSILSHIDTDADDFEKELFIHDYIVNNCTYDSAVALSSSTPYSCLVDGLSACEGYSKAAKLLLEKAGLECYTVSGQATSTDGKTEGHMWNIVNIDGAYYHLDVTWDDPTNQSGKETVSHLFMNLSDEDIGIDHFDYEKFFACDSGEANYFIKNDCLFGKLNSKALSRLKKLMALKNNSHLEIRFKSSSYYSQAFDYLITDGKIYKLTDSANKIYNTQLNTRSVSYIENKERNCIDFYFD